MNKAEIKIRESGLRDIEDLVKILRPEDTRECVKQGCDPAKALQYCYDKALYKRTALIDDTVSAMWGVCGDVLTGRGIPYLLTGDIVIEISPIRFARIYESELSVMETIFSRLENYVDADYKSSIRMLRIAGFTVKPEHQGLRHFIKDSNGFTY